MAIWSVLSGIVKPVADVLNAGTKRKQAKESGLIKIQQAQVDGANTLNLTDAEWEAASVKAGDGTWKDEYVTVTCTVWIWTAMYGSLEKANDAEGRVLDGVKIFLEFCTANNVDMGYLTSAVVLAAVGLKLWRGR